jgi:hypothetical protein
MTTKWSGAADGLVAWSQAPGPQLAVITTGLTAVVGSTFWQVVWLLAVVVAALLQVFPPDARTAADRKHGRRGDGIDPTGPGPPRGLSPL